MLNIACGKNVFSGRDETLAFAPQTELNVAGMRLSLQNRGMTVSFLPESWMDIVYSSIQEIIVTRSTRTFTLVLDTAPHFFQAIPEILPAYQRGPKWRRETSATWWPRHHEHVAHCLVYQIKLMDQDFSPAYSMLSSSKSVTVATQLLERCDLHPGFKDYQTAMRAFEDQLRKMTRMGDCVPFAILFIAETLVRNNYLDPENGILFLRELQSEHEDAKALGASLPLTVEALKQILFAIPYPVSGVESFQVEGRGILQAALEREQELRRDDAERDLLYGGQIPRHQVWVYKAIVTPTTIRFEGPEAEARNRVLRKFPYHNDHFLRVLFCDENGQDLSFNTNVSLEQVYHRYRQVFRCGINVAGRQFEFLGYSHSSLRTHSAWFMAAFTHDNQLHNVETTLEFLGDFGEIRVPARYAARIGQAFSETPYTVPIAQLDILTRHIPDVKSFDGSRVFSDGVGTISWDAIELFWDYIPESAQAATCFQFRLGGYKGMLSLDPKLSGKVICLRQESMMKFPSRDLTELGICDFASKPLRFVLNRQLIKILEDMGIPEEWFLAMQKKALDVLTSVTSSARNTASFVKSQSIGQSLGLSKFIRDLDSLGIDYRKDRFLASVVEHVVLRELRLLKHKARIPVSKGVTLFGVMDEFEFLEEKEVYVTFDRESARDKRGIDGSLKDGLVLVTRSPALHPGDIQGLRMRTPPPGHPLRELRNCVVFSQKGHRDVPSMLSGGDLDGDLYSVIWDADAMPDKLFEPADYPRVTPVPLPRAVQQSDLAEHFLLFMETDRLPLIAVRHQVLADLRQSGTLDPQCIKLAELHSTAVDFSKTGIPVNVRELPPAPTRPHLYVHLTRKSTRLTD